MLDVRCSTFIFFFDSLPARQAGAGAPPLEGNGGQGYGCRCRGALYARPVGRGRVKTFGPIRDRHPSEANLYSAPVPPLEESGAKGTPM